MRDTNATNPIEEFMRHQLGARTMKPVAVVVFVAAATINATEHRGATRRRLVEVTGYTRSSVCRGVRALRARGMVKPARGGGFTVEPPR